MKFHIVAVISFSMLAMGGAFVQGGGTPASTAAAPVSVADSQKISILRSGTQQTSNGAPEHFTGGDTNRYALHPA